MISREKINGRFAFLNIIFKRMQKRQYRVTMSQFSPWKFHACIWPTGFYSLFSEHVLPIRRLWQGILLQPGATVSLHLQRLHWLKNTEMPSSRRSDKTNQPEHHNARAWIYDPDARSPEHSFITFFENRFRALSGTVQRTHHGLHVDWHERKSMVANCYGQSTWFGDCEFGVGFW